MHPGPLAKSREQVTEADRISNLLIPEQRAALNWQSDTDLPSLSRHAKFLYLQDHIGQIVNGQPHVDER